MARGPVAARGRFRAAAVGFVFQQFHLVPCLTVFENVLAPVLAQPRKDAAGRARDLLAAMGLGDRLEHGPAALSTGEKQRVALARALLHEPRVVLADEPTGNLDPANGAIVLECPRRAAGAGAAVLIVTHEAEAKAASDRVLALEAGRIGAAPGAVKP